jgi:hypothetical protein
MGRQMDMLKRSDLWPALDERHRAMIRVVGDLADPPEGPLDPAAWGQYLDDFGIVAEFAASEPSAMQPLVEMIERMYRRVLFAADERVTRLSALPPEPLVDRDGHGIDALPHADP